MGFAVQSGFAASLARPGGNITGVSAQVDEIVVKRMELLKQAVPGMEKVGFLWDTALNEHLLRVTEAASRSLRLEIVVIPIRIAADVPGAFETAVRKGAGGVIVPAGPMLGSARDHIIAQAAKYRLPTAYFSRDFVQAGGLMSYGAGWEEATRLWAQQVDRVLKGATPAELPVVQPTGFTLVINLATARAQGLALPPAFLQRADEVIQ